MTHEWSEPSKGSTLQHQLATLMEFLAFPPKKSLPCAEIALDLAKSILLATNMQALVLSNSISCKSIKSCSALLNEDLSTTE